MVRACCGILSVNVLSALVAVWGVAAWVEPAGAQHLLVVNKSGNSLSLVDPVSRRETTVVRHTPDRIAWVDAVLDLP